MVTMMLVLYCAGSDTSDSDSNAAQTANTPQDTKTVKEAKKKKIKDDTEQPIYPCEECTECFTTQADLKVLLCCDSRVGTVKSNTNPSDFKPD